MQEPALRGSSSGIHRLEGRPRRQWWQTADLFSLKRKKEEDKYENTSLRSNLTFLLSLPFGMAIIYKAAGPESIKVLLLAFAVWVLMAVLLAFQFKNHRKILTDVTEKEDGLELRAPGLNRRLRWMEIRDFFQVENGDGVIECTNGDEWVLSSDLTGANELFALIRKNAPRTAEQFISNYRSPDGLIDGGVMACIAILVAVVMPVLQAILSGQTKDLTSHLIIMFVLGTLALLYIKFKLTQFAQVVRIGKNACYIRSRKISKTIPWTEVKGIKRLGSIHIIKFRQGWFCLLADKKTPLAERLLECKKNLPTVDR